jgi:hypothetical protein
VKYDISSVKLLSIFTILAKSNLVKRSFKMLLLNLHVSGPLTI